MKILAHEHKDIKKMIESKQLSYDDFSFTKRKGNLYIEYQNNELSFVFHRKTETILTESKNWDKKHCYQIYHPERMKDIHDWDLVLNAFENWLLTL